MKKIIGLDVGTNSVGWAVIAHDFDNKKGKIIDLGSRIIPMAQDEISNFNVGNLQSATSVRTGYRGVRRLRERELNRRKRLIKVLKQLGYINREFEVNHKLSFAYNNSKKGNFKFLDSYLEMLLEFKNRHPQLKNVSHDWTIYYLRNKALHEKISKEELAWVILQFNVKRGYFQLRGDDSLSTADNKYFISDIVDNITDLNENNRGNKIFEIELREGTIGQYSAKEEPNWIGKKIEFIATERTSKAGTTLIFSTPDENDWTLRKKKSEDIISKNNQTVGQFIYSKLLENPAVKIRGKEVHTIDRKFYKDELERILTKQAEYHQEFSDPDMLKQVCQLLYLRNEAHRNELSKTSLVNVLLNDIIFYQRPLKSKKHLISNCKFESYTFKENGEWKQKPIKAIAKSHPLFQEFRIWGVLHNLRILEKNYRNNEGVLKQDFDVSQLFLKSENIEKLFELFDSKSEISESQILKSLGLNSTTYKINYEEGKKLKGNETKAGLLKAVSGLEDESNVVTIINNPEKLDLIWHALYSLEEDEKNLKTALQNPAIGLSSHAAEAIAVNIKPYKKDYGSLSRKAISKLLSLMRCGKYWSPDSIDSKTQDRINKIISGEEDNAIKIIVREMILSRTDEFTFQNITDFQGLPEWIANYIIYDRHSESANVKKYNNYDEIDVQKLIPQHSLRNPLVEKILRETMLVVRDIWKEYGKPDEIHVEMARELKLPNDKRKDYTNRRNENQATNERAKAMLRELQKEYSSVNPFSKGHIETFKLYEEGAVNSSDSLTDEIKAIRRKGDPTPSELNRYKLWLDQKYKSPYTGQPIPLSKLFTPEYEIEHVIPQSLFYDNSMNNKIICERDANQLKGNQTAYAFICNQEGAKLNSGRIILSKEDYEILVKTTFRGNRGKIKNLLSFDVPDSFIEKQLNDTRYISRKLLSLLDPVVRDDRDTDNRSRHLIPMVGGITRQLKDDWGLWDIWKKILAPRFKRMNEIHNTDEFYEYKNGDIHLSGYDTDLKRLDHRHHALDALIIACATRNHIQYINSLNNEKRKYELEPKIIRKSNDGITRRIYIKPWEGITQEAFEKLSNTIVSFKKDIRVINRTSNYYKKYVRQKNGDWKKTHVQQEKHPDFWAIRQPLHKETVHGRITLREYKSVNITAVLETPEMIADKSIKKEIKQRLKHFKNDIKAVKRDLKVNPVIRDEKVISKVMTIIYNNRISATRKAIDSNMNEKLIEKVVDLQLRKDLSAHLEKYNNNPDEAFSINGMIDFNKDRKVPVYKTRIMEDLGKKFPLAETGQNSTKYVEAAKGTNLFFIIYRNLETGEYLIDQNSSLGFGDAVSLMKEGEDLALQRDGHDHFILSPNDLVYVFDEGEEKILPAEIDTSRIYKCVSFSKQQCFFTSQYLASPILNKNEFSALNKEERDFKGVMIKNNCNKLKITRLGKIV